MPTLGQSEMTMADVNGDAVPAGTLMQGKRGLVMGVANNRSIAWGIARACAAQGADLAFTFQGDALKKRVEPLAAEIGSKIVLPCDVTDAASMDAVFAALNESWGRLDFLVHAIAFADKAELDGRYVDTSEKNFTQIDADLLLLVHGAGAARREADDKRRLDADAHLLRRREGHAALQRDGRRQGGAGSLVRYLAADLGRRTSVSMPSRPGRSRRWRPRASPTSATSCAGTSTTRRCGAR